MPALDQCHPHIVRALTKAGWGIVSAPYKLSTDVRTVFIDLAVSRGTNGNHQQILLVEVKCFPDRKSMTRDLYTAIGQYLVYQAMLANIGLHIPLFLAVPDDVYTQVFDTDVIKAITNHYIKIVVVNLDSETVTRWIR
jgi:hypothetical protein